MCHPHKGAKSSVETVMHRPPVTSFARSGKVLEIQNGHRPLFGGAAAASALATRYRDLIITLASRHMMPAVYSGR
jgi:hypothetical protein